MFTELLNDTLDVRALTVTQSPSGQINNAWTVSATGIPCRMTEAPKNFAIKSKDYKTNTESFIFFIDPAFASLITHKTRIGYRGKEYIVLKVATFDGIDGAHHVEAYAQIVSIDGQSGIQSTIPLDTSSFVRKTQRVNGHELTGDVTLTKADIGLENVDNTSDTSKPISTATQTALDGKQNTGTNYDDRAYSQAFTGSTVVVTHNMGKHPSWYVIDSSGDEVEGDVSAVSNDSFTLTFSATFSGVVYCN